MLTAIAIAAIWFPLKPADQTQNVSPFYDHRMLVCVRRHSTFCRSALPLDHAFQPYQVKRIYDAIGKDYVPKDQATAAALENEAKTSGKKKDNNYNVKQSKIAIGSEKCLIGKGLLKGTQTRRLDFVPEQKTDFIFWYDREGFGFVGSVLFSGSMFCC